MKKLCVTLALLGAAALIVVGSANSTPRHAASSGYWTPLACKLNVQKYGPAGYGYGIPVDSVRMFHLVTATCVGTGGRQTCTWSPDSRHRLYSEFTVFASSLGHGVIRAFTLATHGPGLGVRHHFGDAYVGTPPDFYVSHFRLIGHAANPTRFNSIVGPLAGRRARQENAKTCAR